MYFFLKYVGNSLFMNFIIMPWLLVIVKFQMMFCVNIASYLGIKEGE